MFTGIVQETGRIQSLEKRGEDAGWRMVVSAQSVLRGLERGDSIAVDGCCLTAVTHDEKTVAFDLLEETFRLTSFSSARAGDWVNLEASLRFDGKIGGHFVTGHIDGIGEVEVFEPRGSDYCLRVRGPGRCGRYLVKKGSIAVAGVSLTVAEVEGDAFTVWLIPHTLEVTNLRHLRPGAPVNLEFDLLGKYVERLLGVGSAKSGESDE